MLVTNFLEWKVEDSSISISSLLANTGSGLQKCCSCASWQTYCSAEQQDLHNTKGLLYTVARLRPELPPPHLLLVDDLLSGPLSSLNPSAPCWSTHPDPKQSLATPSVELLLSNNLFYLVGAAKVVADDVEDKSFWS